MTHSPDRSPVTDRDLDLIDKTFTDHARWAASGPDLYYVAPDSLNDNDAQRLARFGTTIDPYKAALAYNSVIRLAAEVRLLRARVAELESATAEVPPSFDFHSPTRPVPTYPVPNRRTLREGVSRWNPATGSWEKD